MVSTLFPYCPHLRVVLLAFEGRTDRICGPLSPSIRDANFTRHEPVCVAETDRSDEATTARWQIRTVAFALVVFLSSIVPVPSGASAGGSGNGVCSLCSALGVGLTDPFHFVGYAVLAAFLARTMRRSRRGLLVALVTAVTFGFGVELVQSTIPWRSFAWGDAAVNAAGAIVGIGVSVASQR